LSKEVLALCQLKRIKGPFMPTEQSKRDMPWHSPQFYREVHAVAASRVRFEGHNAKQILVVDFSRADLDLVRAVAAECLHVMSAEPPFSVLSLCEVEGIPFSTEALRIGSELTDKCQPYASRTAVSGVAGFRSFLLQAIADAAGRPMKLFKDRASALDWLANGDSEISASRG
jgi:hypothetical protein